MAVTYGFYNSVDGDRKYDAIQVSSLFDGLIQDGIFASIGTRFAVTPQGTGLSIIVGEGRAWFNHTWTLNDTELVLTLEQAHLLYPRIDAVVLEVNEAAEVRENSIKVIKGVAATTPVAPTLENTATLHQYVLAYINVPIAASTLSESNISNRAGLGSTPYVIGIIQNFPIDTIVAQWSMQWGDWRALQEAAYNDWIALIQNNWTEWSDDTKDAFDTWFATFVDELTTEQATNLQLQMNIAGKVVSRQGGSATHWSWAGATDYTPTNIISQCGSSELGFGVLEKTITFAVPFSDIPLVFLQINSNNLDGEMDYGFPEIHVKTLGSDNTKFVVYRQQINLTYQTSAVRFFWHAIGPA